MEIKDKNTYKRQWIHLSTHTGSDSILVISLALNMKFIFHSSIPSLKENFAGIVQHFANICLNPYSLVSSYTSYNHQRLLFWDSEGLRLQQHPSPSLKTQHKYTIQEPPNILVNNLWPGDIHYIIPVIRPPVPLFIKCQLHENMCFPVT